MADSSKTQFLKPRMSEKAYALSQTMNVYAITVPAQANKQTIADAVKAQFDVKLISVNVTNVKGKPKRSVQKKGRLIAKGRQSTVKRAYIKLEQGQSLPFFAAVEEAEAKEKAAEQKAKDSQAPEAKKSRRFSRRAKEKESS